MCALTSEACESGWIAQIPVISPAATSPELSNGLNFPYFLRTRPSEAFVVIALIDILQHYFNYTSVALITSNDGYGTSGEQWFTEQAGTSGLAVSASVVVNSGSNPSQVQVLRASGARVLVTIVSHAAVGIAFAAEATQNGVGGDGFQWLVAFEDFLGDSSAGLGSQVSATLDAGLALRVLKGVCSVQINNGRGTARHDAYLERRHRLPELSNSTSGWCSLERDHADEAYLWAEDHDNNASTPVRCAGDTVGREAEFDPFGYDTVFALAYALHELIEVQNRTTIVGSELLDVLIKKVHFQGVTGLVDLYDASADPNREHHGDRRVGVSWDVLNFVSVESSVRVGSWTQCVSASCTWSDRWQSSGTPFTYSTADNSQPPEVAPPRVTVVRLGVLLPMFGSEETGYAPFPWSPRVGVYQALVELNNKTDGSFDDILPNTLLLGAYRDDHCDATGGLGGAIQLTNSFGGQGVSAIIGAGCSASSVTAAQVASLDQVKPRVEYTVVFIAQR